MILLILMQGEVHSLSITNASSHPIGHKILGILSPERHLLHDEDHRWQSGKTSRKTTTHHRSHHRKRHFGHHVPTTQLRLYTRIPHARFPEDFPLPNITVSDLHLLQSLPVEKESFLGLEDNVIIVSFPSVALATKFLDLYAVHGEIIMADYMPKYFSNKVHAMNVFLNGVLNTSSSMIPKFMETIAILDTGLDVTHPCFSSPFTPLFTLDRAISPKHFANLVSAKDDGIRKVLAYANVRFLDTGHPIETDFVDAPSGHGTHVSGIAAGSCGWDEKENSAARILFVDAQKNIPGEDDTFLAIPPSLWWILASIYETGTRISTNSWGSKGCHYNAGTYELDLFVLEHPDMILVFSAGNSGPANCTIGSPALGKNVISIGSTLNEFVSFQEHPHFNQTHVNTERDRYSPLHVSEFSSRGPTADGRIKPDVSFPGQFIKSANAGTKGESLFMQGTSQAAPSAAAAISMIAGSLKKHGHSHPSVNLVRAILLATTDNFLFTPNLFSVGARRSSSSFDLLYMLKPEREPDDLQERLSRNGFGRPILSHFLEGHISFRDHVLVRPGEPVRLCFDVTNKSPVFTVAMTYLDPPTIPTNLDDSSLLVNNIDLKVYVQQQEKTSMLSGNDKPAGDTVNNIEVVRRYFNKGDKVEIVLDTNDTFFLTLSSSLFTAYLDAVDVALAFPSTFAPTPCGSRNLLVFDPETTNIVSTTQPQSTPYPLPNSRQLYLSTVLIIVMLLVIGVIISVFLFSL